MNEKPPIPEKIMSLVFRRFYDVACRFWRPYSRLLVVPDAGNWSVAWDMMELQRIVRELGIKCIYGEYGRRSDKQSIFFGSQFELLLTPSYFDTSNRLATAYFHGKPGTGVPEFDVCFECLCERHERISRIQVTHAEMRDIILESGIAVEKVMMIPIGINLDFFSMKTAESCRKVRESLGIPQSAVVVGSFQKDGVGWGEGMEPKLIKGPDIFIKTIKALKSSIPELFVLLSGPARGYIKAELARLSVPFCHHYFNDYPEIGRLYQALDLYIVSSRQEGGPKAILESMASGVPIVTSRVGQAMELVKHGVNGWMVDVDDVEGLAHSALAAVSDEQLRREIISNARKCAEANSYSSQGPLWKKFMQGFVG